MTNNGSWPQLDVARHICVFGYYTPFFAEVPKSLNNGARHNIIAVLYPGTTCIFSTLKKSRLGSF
jgi:hypothetical protein